MQLHINPIKEVNTMKHNPYPGYEDQFKSYLQGPFYNQEELERSRAAQGAAMNSYEIPDGMTIEDRIIDGPDEEQKLKIRIYTPGKLQGKVPVVMDVHGGGWVAGNLDIDNARCIALASRIPAIVVGVEYRLSGSPDICFPMPLMDCYTAYKWILSHSGELGSDGQIGLHGSSAGGNLVGGLALYLRDRNEQQPALTCMNCPCVHNGFDEDYSFHQNYDLRMGPDVKALGAEFAYLGGYDGREPSYYAFPLYASDLGMLGPHMILTAEYDTLRDGALKYALRLLKCGVPTEIMMGARSCHCWTAAPGIYTDATHDLIALAFQREFGMLDYLKK